MKKIMIVEDDKVIAEELYNLLVNSNYEACILSDFTNAKSEILKARVDLILLDYEMPVVDGTQVLQMLRQEPATANIPVIFLTGNGNKDAVARVMELKPNGYLLKSTTRLDLVKYLDNKLR